MIGNYWRLQIMGFISACQTDVRKMKIKNTLIVILSLCIIFFTLLVYLLRTKISGFHYGDSDFYKFYQSVRFYFSGQNLYSMTIAEYKTETTLKWVTSNGNLNPPFLTIFLLPLYYLNYANALILWTIGSLILMFSSVWLVLRPFPQWHKYTLPIMAAFTLYMPNSANIAYGQISNYLFILVAGAWIAGRQKRDILAGILIGIACAIKIFCGLFLIYFFCIKRFKLLTSALITGASAFLASLLLFGLDSYLRYRSVLKEIKWYSASWNVSFFGFFTRLFSDSEKNKPLIYIPHLTEILTILCSIALFVYLIYSWRKLGSLHFDIGFSLTLIAMLLLSPLGWIYYFGLLLIPYFVLIEQSNETRYHNIVPIILCIILFFSSLSGNFISTSGIKTTEEVLVNGGTGFYTLIALFILSIVLIKEKLSLSPITTLPQKHIILEPQWYIFYAVAFAPSFISFVCITTNVWSMLN